MVVRKPAGRALQAKGPEVGSGLACLRSSKDARVAGVEWTKGPRAKRGCWADPVGLWLLHRMRQETQEGLEQKKRVTV